MPREGSAEFTLTFLAPWLGPWNVIDHLAKLGVDMVYVHNNGAYMEIEFDNAQVIPLEHGVMNVG